MESFLAEYGINIGSIMMLGAFAAPFIRKRIVSDKNMMNVFDNVKTLAKSTNAKAVNIKLALNSINKLVANIQIENEIQNKRIND